MRLEQLRYLEAIVRCKSFRAAADDLDVSEPTLSQQLKRLEDELGGTLVERRRGSVRPTALGASILPHVASMLTGELLIQEAADEHHGLRAGELRLGTVNAGSNTVLPQVLPAFNARYPGIRVRVTETGSLDIERAVLGGSIDLGLLVFLPELYGLDPALHVEELLRSDLVICVSAAHRLSRRSRIAISDLANERLILFRQGYLLHEITTTLLGSGPTNVVYYTDNTESAKRMAAAGVGILLLPEFSVVDDSYRKSGKIVYVPLKTNFPPIRLGMVHRKDTHLPRAAKVFAQMLRDSTSVADAAHERQL